MQLIVCVFECSSRIRWSSRFQRVFARSKMAPTCGNGEDLAILKLAARIRILCTIIVSLRT